MFFVESMSGSLSVLLDFQVWLFILVGVTLGSLFGALPGLGTTLGYALLIPFTFGLDPVLSISMLLAFSVGTQYANSLPAITLGVPGTSAAIMTVMDGYALYKRGKGDIALGASYLGSMIGQLVSIPLFLLLVIPLANLAYLFQPPEMFGILILGFMSIVALTGKSVLKGLISIVFGLIVGLVGLDPISTAPRFTFGILELRGGLEPVAVVIGVLAVGEIFRNFRQAYTWDSGDKRPKRVRLPRLSAIGGRDMVAPLTGGTVIGLIVGAIPGAGAAPAAMISYQQAKLWSKRPEEFGKGSVAGIMSNEAAQNSSNSGELIPTFALGIPGSGSMVVLLSALMAQGFVPGPFLIRDAPHLLYASAAGMLGGTIILIIVGMRMGSWMLWLARANRSVVFSTALALITIGVWSLRGSQVDVLVMLIFGVIGYFMYRYGYSPAAMALSVILATPFERSLRFGLSLSDDSWGQLITRPITGGLLIAALLLLGSSVWRQIHSTRKQAERAA